MTHDSSKYNPIYVGSLVSIICFSTVHQVKKSGIIIPRVSVRSNCVREENKLIVKAYFSIQDLNLVPDSFGTIRYDFCDFPGVFNNCAYYRVLFWKC